MLGFAFCQWVVPILDELQALFLSWIETKKGNMAIKIAEANAKTTEISNSMGNNKTQAIGFCIEDEGEEDDDE